MRIVATTSQLIGARFIRWLIGEKASHLIFVFNELQVVHSSLLGVQLDFYKSYKKHIVEVESVEIPMPLSQEDKVWQDTLILHDDDGYDYKGLMYGFWRAILLKFFKIPPPETNKWDNPNLETCVEMYNIMRKLAPELGLPDLGDVSLKTPLQIVRLIKNHMEGAR